MNYYPLQLQPMQESGGSLLRAIQNDSMNPLDLLCRESVQNSLDAALEVEGGEVHVDYLIRSHTATAIFGLLRGGIDTDAQENRFSGARRLLEIRDSRTEGLSGPLVLSELRSNERHGNLLKLVYEIGRSRHDEAAGGSWGLGKTCYFRMGIGLVFYYTRVRHEGCFQERLVACLVEDEDDPARIQTSTRTGIAWWGAPDGAPVTDADEICHILKSLGATRYEALQTGTAIFIPFLKDDLIPAFGDSDDTDDGNPPPPGSRPWWFGSYDDYIRIALQRWFCPRIDNPHFRSGPKLVTSVNGKRVHAGSMMPVFRVVQSLYNRAGIGVAGEDDFLSALGLDEAAVLESPIRLNSEFAGGGEAGKIIAVLLTREQMRMGPPDNLADPHTHVYGQQAGEAPYRPLVTFMRRPGMLIRWEDNRDNRGWCGGLAGASDGRFLIALFVPSQDRQLAPGKCLQLKKPGASLEVYLRGCEKADHHHWNDQAGFTIISKIRNGVGKRLKEFGSGPGSKTVHAPALRTARNLADRLLPQGFGTDGRNGPARVARKPPPDFPPRASNTATSTPVLLVTRADFRKSGMVLQWSMQWGSAAGGREIHIEVDSESGPITAGEWQQEGLGDFPFRFIEASILSVEGTPARTAKEPALTLSGTFMRLDPADTMSGTRIEGELYIGFDGEMARDFSPVVSAKISTEAA